MGFRSGERLGHSKRGIRLWANQHLVLVTSSANMDSGVVLLVFEGWEALKLVNNGPAPSPPLAGSQPSSFSMK
jgi:hypothetical protein